MDHLPPLPLCLLASALRGASRRHPTDAPTALAAVRPAGKNQATRLGSARNDGPESFPLLFLWGERCCRCWCPALLAFSCVGRLGTLAAATASAQAKPPSGAVAAHGCPPTPARDRKPGTVRHGLSETSAEVGCSCPCAGGAKPRPVLAGRFPDQSGPETVPR